MHQSIKNYVVPLFVNLLKIFPYAFFLSMIMSTGWIIQRIFTKIFTSEESSIYDSINDGLITLTHSQDFMDWCKFNFEPLYIIPSLLVVSFALRGGYAKKILIKLSLLIFTTLTIVDYFKCLKIEADSFLTCIISNAIGSVVIAGIVILSLEMGRVVNRYFENNNVVLQKFVDSIVAVLFGTSIVFFVYIIDINIFSLTKSKVDITMKLPIEGSYKSDFADENHTEKSFGLFSVPMSNIDHFEWSGFGQNFSLDWKKSTKKTSSEFDAEVRVLDECYNDNSKLIKTLSNSPTYIIKNINELKLSTDDGITDIHILNNKFYVGKIAANNTGETKFYIRKSREKKGYELTRIIKQSTNIKHSSWVDGAFYALTFINLDTNDNNDSSIINRKVTIQTDKKRLDIDLIANTNLMTNMKTNCKVLPNSKDNIYNLESIFSGVILTLKKHNIEDVNLVDIDNPEETQITGMMGWMAADNVTKKEFSNFISDGRLNSLNLKAPIESMIIDEKDHKQEKQTNDIQMSDARLIGELTEDGFLRFTGTSKAIYNDGKRENTSRWEKLDTEYKILIFTLCSGVFLILFKRLLKILDQNEQFSVIN
ncbi:MAG: hypothetical protein PHQ22_04925 [Sulfuricurvum sp.]|nr:hypothetical protein [Sulfuricurvum sp.]MDD5386522.1 hypothetical protein [Sulfuricurvum sp.]MDO9207334.1 hypothetical protein [Sulfuricurvum sp.]